MAARLVPARSRPATLFARSLLWLRARRLRALGDPVWARARDRRLRYLTPLSRGGSRDSPPRGTSLHRLSDRRLRQSPAAARVLRHRLLSRLASPCFAARASLPPPRLHVEAGRRHLLG